MITDKHTVHLSLISISAATRQKLHNEEVKSELNHITSGIIQIHKLSPPQAQIFFICCVLIFNFEGQTVKKQNKITQSQGVRRLMEREKQNKM